MTTFILTFVIALVVGWVTTYLIRNLALARGWVEPVGGSSRKIHERAIPRLGGVAIVLGFFAPLVALLLVDSGVGETYKASPSLLIGIFGGGLLVAVLGLYDDFHGANASKKFVVQFAVAAGLWALGFRIETIATPLFGNVQLGLLGLPLSLFWMVGIINAMNLIDGLDGLAGGVAFFAVATNFVLALSRGDVLMSLMMVALAGSIIGFLAFNFNPASIFMGDTGSMFLGFVLGAISIKSSQKSGTAVALLVPVLALGLPIMDTLLAIGRRTLRGRGMFSADKEHIHHRMMSRLSLSHRKAVLALYGVSSLFALLSLGLAYASNMQAGILLVCVAGLVFLFVRALGYLNWRASRELAMDRERNLRLRGLVKASSDKLRAAKGLNDVHNALIPVAEGLIAGRFELAITGRPGPATLVVGESTIDESMALMLVVHAKLGGSPVGKLSVGWADGRAEVDRDEERAVELLAGVIAETIARLAQDSNDLADLPREH